MLLGMGVLALLVVIVGVVVVIMMAGRQANEERAPRSEPGDFVAPVSSGGYAWRAVDETPDQFKDRIRKENTASDGKKV